MRKNCAKKWASFWAVLSLSPSLSLSLSHLVSLILCMSLGPTCGWPKMSCRIRWTTMTGGGGGERGAGRGPRSRSRSSCAHQAEAQEETVRQVPFCVCFRLEAAQVQVLVHSRNLSPSVLRLSFSAFLPCEWPIGAAVTSGVGWDFGN